jgi:uncharacterized LabA/DUF88 family protein
MLKKREIIYVFIDSQNLNLGINKDVKNKNKKILYKGWKLDNQKFRIYLKDKFKVEKVFLFIGFMQENKGLYEYLKKSGYQLIFKPTVKDASGKVKGNVDAELVLYSSKIEYKNYDKAIIISGDGDFYCLVKELKKDKKLKRLIIPNKYSQSRLLKEFEDDKFYIQLIKNKVERKTKTSG